MGSRTVRLDDDAERALEEIRRATGLSISATMKRGLLALRGEVAGQARRVPYDVYRELDVGAGGYAIAPSTRTRRGVRSAIRRKLRR